jgi:hypothetical protein
MDICQGLDDEDGVVFGFLCPEVVSHDSVSN